MLLPDDAPQLDVLGITVTEQVRTGPHLTQADARYLVTRHDHTAQVLSVAG